MLSENIKMENVTFVAVYLKIARWKKNIIISAVLSDIFIVLYLLHLDTLWIRHVVDRDNFHIAQPARWKKKNSCAVMVTALHSFYICIPVKFSQGNNRRKITFTGAG